MERAQAPEEALPLGESEAALRELLRRVRFAPSLPLGLPMPQELPLQNHAAAYCWSFIKECWFGVSCSTASRLRIACRTSRKSNDRAPDKDSGFVFGCNR